MTAQFQVQKDGQIAWLINNRPDSLNAMRNETWGELNSAIDEIDRDLDIRVVIITGEGSSFCAGADVKSMDEDIDIFTNRKQALNEIRLGQTVLQDSTRKIRSSRVPYIAAIHGFAVGAGFELCMACDLVVAERLTQMGFPEVNVGVVITNGGTFFAPRILGLAKAREMAYTGEFIDAEEAYRLGFICRLAEKGKVRDEAEKLALRIASRAPGAVTLHKKMLDAALQSSLESALLYETETTFTTVFSKDHAEGANAFVEKREPKFTGF